MRTFLCFVLVVALMSPACRPDNDGDGGDDGSVEDPYDGVFPRLPPVSHLLVYNAREETREMKYLLTSLQGVVNRTEPRIYLFISIWDGIDPFEHEDFWLEEIAENFGVTYEMVDDPWTLVETFADELAGTVVYDPDMPLTINVGTIAAGVRDSVLVHPSLLEKTEARGLSIVEDLRGRFASNVEMYTWAFETLWPECNHGILAYQSPEYPVLRDYIVAQKIFVLGLDLHRAEERALLESIYAQTPQNISVLGWVLDEVLGVKLLTESGKFHNPSESVANLSVTAGLTPFTFEPREPPPIPPLENRIYVAFSMTDGDNLTYIHLHMVDRWQDPARGTFPLGWEMNTTLQSISPAAYRYYRATASPNDAFIGPVVGIGYMYPNLHPDLPRFLELSRAAYKRHDYRNIWLITNELAVADDVITTYSEAMDIEGVFQDYWGSIDRGWYLASDGTPVVHTNYVYLVGTEQIEWILADAATQKEFHYPDVPTFVFIGVNGWATPPHHAQGDHRRAGRPLPRGPAGRDAPPGGGGAGALM